MANGVKHLRKELGVLSVTSITAGIVIGADRSGGDVPIKLDYNPRCRFDGTYNSAGTLSKRPL